MFRRNDPRLRRTLNQLSQNLESANESAQNEIYNFSQKYVSPCLDSVGQCLRASTATCFPTREERLRRQRGRSRGRPELSFDFYDDWEAEENDALLGWDNDELDRLLSGTAVYGATSSQPTRHRTMSYGTRNMRRTAVPPHGGGQDPTIIPNTSYIGFLGRLPWKLGRKALRYKPSAADLQEHPGTTRRSHEWEEEALLETDEGTTSRAKMPPAGRGRSGTAGSADTADSLSSRGDLFPSEDEDDAVPIDDEFSLALDRRTTNTNLDDTSSGKTGSPKRRPKSNRTASSKTSRTNPSPRHHGTSALPSPAAEVSKEVPSVIDLRQEDDRVAQEEERRVERKRNAAKKLAFRVGLETQAGTVENSSSHHSTSAEVSQVTSPSVSSPIAASVLSPETRSQTDEPAVPPSEQELGTVTEEPQQNHNQSTFNPARLPHFHPD